MREMVVIETILAKRFWQPNVERIENESLFRIAETIYRTRSHVIWPMWNKTKQKKGEKNNNNNN